MVQKFACVLGLLGLVVAEQALAAKVSEMPVIHTSGSWELRKGVDSFTDEVSCVATPKGDISIQATDETFYIGGARGRGGLQGYRYRLDNNDPVPLRLATDMEQKIQNIILEGGEYQDILGAKRLRVLAVGLLSNTGFEKDISLVGLKAVLSRWNAEQCG